MLIGRKVGLSDELRGIDTLVIQTMLTMVYTQRSCMCVCVCVCVCALQRTIFLIRLSNDVFVAR